MDIEKALTDGITDGTNRLNEALSAGTLRLEIPPDRWEVLTSDRQTAQLEAWRSSLMDLLKGEELSEPFARAFSEMTTVAQGSRVLFGEAALTPEQLKDFLEVMKDIRNSFRHL